MTDVLWMGEAPEECQLCNAKIEHVFVDGKIEFSGAWAIMCPACALLNGVGLGEGKGQFYGRLSKKDDFRKIKG